MLGAIFYWSLTIDDVHIIRKHASFSIHAVYRCAIFIVGEMRGRTGRTPATILDSKYFPTPIPGHLSTLFHGVLTSEEASF